MTKDKQDAAISKAIHDYEFWKSQWQKKNCAFSVVMVSPRGKAMNHISYCFELERRMVMTIKKIRKVLDAQEQQQ